MARPIRQLPVCTWINGENDAANAAPPMIAVTYRPMNSETLSRKRDLISAGINAWISAMPTPAAMALRINSAAESRNSRDSVARPITTSDSTMLRCSPKRLPRPMPKNIAKPIAITGSMVNNDAVLKLSGISPRIDDNKGPTAAMDGRRLRATSTTLIISQRAVVGLAWTFSMGGP
jgi:hypothetical protein